MAVLVTAIHVFLRLGNKSWMAGTSPAMTSPGCDGAMLDMSGAVPVVIKSLVFPTSAGIGKDWQISRPTAADLRA